MKRAIYTERKTLVKYDDNRYMAYLNEEVIDGYVPEVRDGEEAPEPVTGYAYTGAEPDGGTLIAAADMSRYSQTEEDAIKTHQIEVLKDGGIAKAADYEVEWEAFSAFRTAAIATVDRWLE